MLPTSLDDFLHEAAGLYPAMTDSLAFIRTAVARMDTLACELDCRADVCRIAEQDELDYGERLQLICDRLGKFWEFVKSGERHIN